MENTISRLAALEVSCLGPFRVWVNGHEIEHWPNRNAKSILKYLISQPRRQASKDTLMQLLWPDVSPQQANSNLRTTIRVLRRILNFPSSTTPGFPWIIFNSDYYYINPEVHPTVDFELFLAHWENGKKLEKELKVSEGMGQYRLATDLYKGDYFEDDLFDDYTLVRRESLKDIYLIMLSRLGDQLMEKLDFHGCIDYCRSILSRDPCREDVYRRIMFCYSQMGQRARALGWFQLCRKILKDELDLDPDGDTMALHQSLVKGKDIDLFFVDATPAALKA